MLDIDTERAKLTGEYKKLCRKMESPDELRDLGMKLAKLDEIERYRKLALKTADHISRLEIAEAEYEQI